MAQIPRHSDVVSFDAYEVHLPTHELFKHGSRIKLAPQAFRVLQMLLDHPGELVTREEFRRALWPADTFVDFDQGLNSAIKKIRDALCDSAETPRYIETLPKLGYRFVHEVNELDSREVSETKEDLPSLITDQRTSRNGNWGQFAGGLAMIAVASFVLDLGGIRTSLLYRPSAQPGVQSSVVLPFEPAQQARSRQARKVNPEAYEAYLKGLSLDRVKHHEIEKAKSYFEVAIQKDPDFAPAYVELARAYRNLGQFLWLSPRDAFPPAKQAVRKALELDDSSCDAHWSLAWLNWQYDWDWQSAEKELKTTIALCPNSATFHEYYAHYLGCTGRTEEALGEITKSHELDPLMDDYLIYKALIYYQIRNYDEMLELGELQISSHPSSWLGHYILGNGYEGSGRTLEAMTEYQKATELSDGDLDPVASLAHTYIKTGNRVAAEKILHDLLRRSEISYVSPYMIATIYAGLGNNNKALELLEKAYRERSGELPYFLKSDPRIDNVRSDRRFQNLLGRMNFRD